MKVLIFDTNLFKYKLDHPTPVAEKIDDNLKQGEFGDAMIVFVAVEIKDTEKTIEKAKNDIIDIAIKNKTKLLIINPFAHLSSSLARPNDATKLLNLLTEELQKYSKFKTERSVFGWYKEFTIDVKGHENSQIFREY